VSTCTACRLPTTQALSPDATACQALTPTQHGVTHSAHDGHYDATITLPLIPWKRLRETWRDHGKPTASQAWTGRHHSQHSPGRATLGSHPQGLKKATALAIRHYARGGIRSLKSCRDRHPQPQHSGSSAIAKCPAARVTSPPPTHLAGVRNTIVNQATYQPISVCSPACNMQPTSAVPSPPLKSRKVAYRTLLLAP